MTRAEIEKQLLAWMREQNPAHDETRFNQLACELFAFQYAACAPYRRLCEARGITPNGVGDWREVPAAPAAAFKTMALRCFAPAATVKTFRSSGTSLGGGARSELHLDSLHMYEASLAACFARANFAPPQKPLQFFVLAPSPREAPDSSLSHMFGALMQKFGAPQSAFFVRVGALQIAALEAALAQNAAAECAPLICGTAFAFVHWLDNLAARGKRLQLPPQSAVMETGGFKGRSRELSRENLYALIQKHLGVAPRRVINQYGMTELGGQFYDSTLAQPESRAAPRRKLPPPWTRVRVLHPQSGAELPAGERGVLQINDLANTGSVAALLTADLGRRVCGDGFGDGFEIIGRAPGAEQRGCSIAADLMLRG